LKHPLSLEASIALSIPIDTIIRKGIDEMNNVIDIHTTVSKANHPASSSIIPSHTSSIENQTSALTVHRHHHPADRNANNTHVCVTSPDHTSNSSSAVIPNDELMLQATLPTNTTTATMDRPSVVTFQDQIFSTPVVNARLHVDSSDHYTDEADRLLLTAGSDFLNSSSQHQHLMLPSQHNHYAERNDDSSEDDEGPRNTNEIGEEGFEDHEDGDVSEMMMTMTRAADDSDDDDDSHYYYYDSHDDDVVDDDVDDDDDHDHAAAAADDDDDDDVLCRLDELFVIDDVCISN
jgi:hypothetical protein